MNTLKWYLLLVVLLMKVLDVTAQTNEEAPAFRKNAVKLNLLPLPFGSANLMYERRISGKTSTGITLTAYPKRLIKYEEDTIAVYAITGEFRYYFKRDALNGFYLNPYLKYHFRKNNAFINDVPYGHGSVLPTRQSREEEKWSSFGGGIALGYQLVLPQGLLFNFYGGLGRYARQHLRNETSYTEEQKKNRAPLYLDFRAGLVVGYAF